MYFELDIPANLESGRCLPLYILHEYMGGLKLVGGFVAKKGDRVGFFASKESWLGLMAEGDNKFYFRPIRDELGVVVGGMLEEAKSSVESIEISTTEATDGGN